MSKAEASIASRHVGEIGLGHGIVGERAVAEPAGRGEGDRLVERAAGEAERGGGDGDPEQVQRRIAMPKPSPGAPINSPRTPSNLSRASG